MLVALSLIHGAAGSDYRDSFKLKGTDSADALALLQQASPKASGDSDRIVIATSGGASVTDPAVKARVDAMLAEVAKQPHVGTVTSPFAPGASGQISSNGKVAYATVTFDQQANDLPESAAKRVISVAQSAENDNVRVELGGQAIELANRQGVGRHRLRLPRRGGRPVPRLRLPARDAAAAVTTGFALGTGIAVIGLLSHVITMARSARSCRS